MSSQHSFMDIETPNWGGSRSSATATPSNIGSQLSTMSWEEQTVTFPAGEDTIWSRQTAAASSSQEWAVQVSATEVSMNESGGRSSAEPSNIASEGWQTANDGKFIPMNGCIMDINDKITQMTSFTICMRPMRAL